MVRVKICGITNLDDALAAIECGADALGFVFAKSPRRVTPALAKEICGMLPPFISKVGVFVDEEANSVDEIAKKCGLDTLQFHGSEDPAYLQSFKGAYKVIKAFRVPKDFEPDAIKGYDVDGILLDTYAEGKAGGSGRVFDWDIAVKVKDATRIPLILSGGLDGGNIERAIKEVSPFAVDVSSGVEVAPGKKEKDKMKEFIRAAKGR